MGGLCTQPIVQSDKKVVIVGASFAGLNIAEQLWNQFEVVIIDKNEYFEYICSGSKSIVSDDHFDNISLNYAQLLRQNQNKATFLQGSIESIHPSQNYIEISTQQSNEIEKISYDYLVLCTGSSYGEPIKDDDITSMDQRKSKLAIEQEAIKRADSILVVGSGPVAIEVIGEIVHMNSLLLSGGNNNQLGDSLRAKKITLVSRSSGVLPRFMEKAQVYATQFLENNGVELLLEREYDEEFQNKYGHLYDHVIHCQGTEFKTNYMKKSPEISDCVNRRGQILVNEHMQITNVDPLINKISTRVTIKDLVVEGENITEVLDEDNRLLNKESRQKVFSNIFSVGDACLTPANEEKTVFPLKQCAKVCAHNIRTLAFEEQNQRLKRIPVQFDGIYSISLGPNDGILLINNFAIFGQKAANYKIGLQNKYIDALKGDESQKKKLNNDMTKLECLLSVCNTNICSCCPCSKHNKPSSRATKVKDL